MNEKTILRRRRSLTVLIIALSIIGASLLSFSSTQQSSDQEVLSFDSTQELAIDALEELEVKGRSPKTGYSRSEFGSGWASVGGCDMRNIILNRSVENIELSTDGCVVLSGTLADPYSGENMFFMRGRATSSDVQIDHMVALSDAWQKGAQKLSPETRETFANDPLNLLAVNGDLNQQKGDSDAASWLPPNKSFRCRYVARQIAVKKKYQLWITEAEKSSMKRVLNSCKSQALPNEF